jgi:serine O-acetyltransferase
MSTCSANPSRGGFRTLWEILREDWQLQSSAIERGVVLTYRLRHWGRTRRPRWAWRLLSILLVPQEFLMRVLMSGQISAQAVIGRRIRIPHAWGIVIHSSVVVGDDCTLLHQVTLGVNEHRTIHIGPHLENGVYVGAGAKVIGAITVGERSVVGANAVVVEDVPASHAAVGVPARCKPRRDRTHPEQTLHQE